MRRRSQLIIAIVAVVVVCLLLYMVIIRPRRSELSEIRSNIDSAMQEQAQLQQQLEVLRDLQDRAPELQAELDEIRGFVPEEPDIPNFIFQVQQAANQAGVDVVQIQPELPEQPPEGAALAEIRTIIRAQGGYFAVQDFVRRLYDLDRALRIDTMTLGPPGTGSETDTTTGTTTGATGGGQADPGDIEANMAARIFFEIPEGAGTGGAAPTTPEVAPSPSPETAPSPAPTDGAGATPTPAATP